MTVSLIRPLSGRDPYQTPRKLLRCNVTLHWPARRGRMGTTAPWRGVLVATALPWREDGGVDHDRYAEHVRWLAANGCDGVVPNGSRGGDQVATPSRGASRGRSGGHAARP